MFDVPIENKTRQTITAELPIETHPWQVGLITGPSGSGKTSIARQLWGEQLAADLTWSDDRSLLDDFPPEMSITDVVDLLTAVGLGSPPAWLRPYRTLSNGEAFRASMARALAAPHGDLVVVDEFTSVVDRQVAKVASHAIQKTVRRRKQQLIAVTCHYDVEDWLQPDWVYDVAAAEFRWRSVQPHPQLELQVYSVDRSAWRLFAHHHYLSSELNASARCYGGWVGDQLVAFASYRHLPHPTTKTIKMGHRHVVLPDYQGLGISGRMNEWLGERLWAQGYRYRNVIAHPAMIAYFARSPRWVETGRRAKRLAISAKAGVHLRKAELDPRRLGLRSFEYRPPGRI